MAAMLAVPLPGCIYGGSEETDVPFEVQGRDVEIVETVCDPEEQTASVEFGSESDPSVALRGTIFAATRRDSLFVVPRFSPETPDRMTISVQTDRPDDAEDDCPSGLRYDATIHFDRLPAYVEVVHDPADREFDIVAGVQREGTELEEI